MISGLQKLVSYFLGLLALGLILVGIVELLKWLIS